MKPSSEAESIFFPFELVTGASSSTGTTEMIGAITTGACFVFGGGIGVCLAAGFAAGFAAGLAGKSNVKLKSINDSEHMKRGVQKK